MSTEQLEFDIFSNYLLKEQSTYEALKYKYNKYVQELFVENHKEWWKKSKKTLLKRVIFLFCIHGLEGS